MKLVLDASVAVAAARPNEPSHLSSRARVSRALRGADEIVVPALFPIEVGSALARAGEEPDAIRVYVDGLVAVALGVFTIGPNAARKIRDLAIASKLRAADATYVWLAQREGVPLCSLDRELGRRGAAWCSVIEP